MAIQEVTMYRVLCDRCGTSAQDGGDYYAWAVQGQAVDDAEGSDWLVRDGGHWCRECVIYDGERDEYVPKSPEGAGKP